MARIEVRMESNVPEVERAVKNAVERALEAVGLQGEGNAKMHIEIPKEHGDGDVRPNVDTGRLVNSITHVTNSSEKVVYIGTNVEYAPYVELGTSKSRPYPYLRPAVEEHTDEYKRIFEEYLKDA